MQHQRNKLWRSIILAVIAVWFSFSYIIPLVYDFFVYPERGYIIRHGNVVYTYIATINEGVWRKRRYIVLPEADIDTFRVIETPNIAVDKELVFIGGKVKLGAHGPTYEKIDNNGYYWKDRNSVWRAGRKLEGADPANFRLVFGNSLGRDNDQVFSNHTPVTPCDIASFRAAGPKAKDGKILYIWWRDDQCIYKGSFKAEFADPESFVALSANFAKDKHSIISAFGRPERKYNIDLDTFYMVNKFVGKDKYACYNRERLENCPKN